MFTNVFTGTNSHEVQIHLDPISSGEEVTYLFRDIDGRPRVRATFRGPETFLTQEVLFLARDVSRLRQILHGMLDALPPPDPIPFGEDESESDARAAVTAQEEEVLATIAMAHSEEAS